MSKRHPQHSISALAYLRKKRETKWAHATWFDVADAYDAGMKHALEARGSAKRVMQELQHRATDSATEVK